MSVKKEERTKLMQRRKQEFIEPRKTENESAFQYQWEPVRGVLATPVDGSESPSKPLNLFSKPNSSD